jgi:hypothetical protein
MKSIRFRCDQDLLNNLDKYKTRFVCRTEIIQAALSFYIKSVEKNNGRLLGIGGWS